MDLKNIDGKVIFSGNYSSINQLLDAAVKAGAKLTGVKLAGVNLARANLIRADLRGAIISGAILSGADLSGTGIDEDDLEAAGADFNENTKF